MIGLPDSTSLCGTFSAASSWVWSRLALATRRGLSFSEPTITELLLSELALRHPAEIEVLPFSARKEAKTGADWAWCFIDKGGTRFLPLLVQAKRLYKSGRYDHLLHVVKGPPKKLQIDLLISKAGQRGWGAVHIFYNHPAPLKQSMAQRMLTEEWGCSFALSHHVRQLVSKSGKTGLETLFPIMSPWQVLVCPKRKAAGRRPALPEFVARTLNKMASLDHLGELDESKADTSKLHDPEKYHTDLKWLLDEKLSFEPTAEAPAFIKFLDKAKRDDKSGFHFPRPAQARELRSLYSNMRGAVIIRER